MLNSGQKNIYILTLVLSEKYFLNENIPLDLRILITPLLSPTSSSDIYVSITLLRGKEGTCSNFEWERWEREELCIDDP